MKKILFVFNLMLLSTLIANGEEKPLLKFKPDATFKIVQFTDTHLQYDSYRSDSVLVMMKKVIEREKPDLVILTGDVVGSDNRKRAWLKVAQVMIDAKTPWAAMFGNHDAEYELDKEQTMDIIVGLPYSLTERGPKGVNGLSNYILPIQSSTSSKTAALCYVLDVSETAYPLEDQTGTFTWIDDSQVEWYKKESAAYASQNGGTPIPALAFFHIPFPEFNEVAGKSTTVGVQWELNPAPPPDQVESLCRHAELQRCHGGICRSPSQQQLYRMSGRYLPGIWPKQRTTSLWRSGSRCTCHSAARRRTEIRLLDPETL
jgi:hypothetical protein